MADYTYQELMRMQDDAVRRVEDMQRRARATAGIDEKSNAENNISEKPSPRHIPQPSGYLVSSRERTREEAPERKEEKPFLDNLRKGFGSMEIDEDKALILSLVLLLSREGGDEELLTALIYMLT